jgi:hypothetical protein
MSLPRYNMAPPTAASADPLLHPCSLCVALQPPCLRLCTSACLQGLALSFRRFHPCFRSCTPTLWPNVMSCLAHTLSVLSVPAHALLRAP